MIRLFDAFPNCEAGGHVILQPPRGIWIKGLNSRVNIELRGEDGPRKVASFLKALSEPAGDWIQSFQVDLRWKEIEGQRWEVWALSETVEVQDCRLATDFAHALRPRRTTARRYGWSEILPRGFTVVEIQPSFDRWAALVLSSAEEPSWGSLLVERTPLEPREPLERLPSEYRDCELQRALSATLFATREAPRHVWLDGIGYDVWMASDDCRANISFSNPRVGPLRDLETAIVGACRELASGSERERVRLWPAVFERYFPRS